MFIFCNFLISVLLLVSINCQAEKGNKSTKSAGVYLWSKNQATVLANGDLKWNPEPFVFQPGSSVRYIDFENGDDSANGTSKTTPWKHHPWDPNAVGNADVCSGTHTYVFKRGVVYRGTLTSSESGTEGENIQLTSDPAWGTGEAMIYGV